jgi:hypothetical protein
METEPHLVPSANSIQQQEEGINNEIDKPKVCQRHTVSICIAASAI